MLLRQQAIFLEYAIVDALWMKHQYIAVHVRGGDKALEIELPDPGLYFKFIAYTQKNINYISKTTVNTLVYAAGDRREVTSQIVKEMNGFDLPQKALDPRFLYNEFNNTTITNTCHYPCVLFDMLFDVLMLARSEVFLMTSGSGFGKYAYRIQKDRYGGNVFSVKTSDILNSNRWKERLKSFLYKRTKVGLTHQDHFSKILADPRTTYERTTHQLLLHPSYSIYAHQLRELIMIHPYIYVHIAGDDNLRDMSNTELCSSLPERRGESIVAHDLIHHDQVECWRRPVRIDIQYDQCSGKRKSIQPPGCSPTNPDSSILTNRTDFNVIANVLHFARHHAEDELHESKHARLETAYLDFLQYIQSTVGIPDISNDHLIIRYSKSYFRCPISIWM